MADALILEFDGVKRSDYDAVNGALGYDPVTGAGDAPEGLLYHAAGAKPGGWVVFEVWRSREDQDRFLDSRLGAALQKGGVGTPSRLEWVEVAAARQVG